MQDRFPSPLRALWFGFPTCHRCFPENTSLRVTGKQTRSAFFSERAAPAAAANLVLLRRRSCKRNALNWSAVIKGSRRLARTCLRRRPGKRAAVAGSFSSPGSVYVCYAQTMSILLYGPSCVLLLRGKVNTNRVYTARLSECGGLEITRDSSNGVWRI